MRQSGVWLAVLALGVGLAACEPTSVTEARNQLGRGGERTLAYVIPVATDTLTVGKILSDFVGVSTDTLSDGIVSIDIPPKSLGLDVGQQLRFDNINFDQFQFDFSQMLTTSEVMVSATPISPSAPGPVVGIPRTSGQTAAANFTTPDGSTVESATISSGNVERLMTNGTDCAVDVSMALVDANGDTAAVFPDVTVAANGGSVNDATDIVNAMVVQSLRALFDATPAGGCTPSGGQLSGAVTFHPLTLSQVALSNVNEAFTQDYPELTSETRLQAVDTVVASSGSIQLPIQNRLPVALDVAVTFNGIRGPGGGAPLVASGTVPAAPGDGTTTSSVLTIDLTGATILPQVSATVAGTVTAPSATITPSVTQDAVIVDGTGSLVVQRLSGALDPTKTAELNVSVEQSQEVPRGDLGLGQFETVVDSATLNTVQVRLAATNSANALMRLQNLRLGAVPYDPATGQPRRDTGGNLVFETYADGTPIFVDTTFTVGKETSTTVVLRNAATAALVDRLVDSLLSDVRMAIVASGTAVVGDGSQASISATDSVQVVADLAIGLDLTLPADGVAFDSTTVRDGLAVDTVSAFTSQDAIIQALDSAVVSAAVENGTPFEVEASIVAVADSIAGNAFQAPGHVDLGTVMVSAASVDPNGQVTTPTNSSVSLGIAAADTRVFLGRQFTAGIRVVLKPPSGARGALRVSDQLIVRATAKVFVHTGGTQ